MRVHLSWDITANAAGPLRVWPSLPEEVVVPHVYVSEGALVGHIASDESLVVQPQGRLNLPRTKTQDHFHAEKQNDQQGEGQAPKERTSHDTPPALLPLRAPRSP